MNSGTPRMSLIFCAAGAKNSDPMPLRESEVRRMLGAADEALEPVADTEEIFVVGEPVKVTYGPFSGFQRSDQGG